MRNREGGHGQPQGLEGSPGVEQLPDRRHLLQGPDPPGGLPVGEDLQPRMAPQQGREAAAMVAVLMGDEDRVDLAGLDAQRRQTGGQPGPGEPHVD